VLKRARDPNSLIATSPLRPLVTDRSPTASPSALVSPPTSAAAVQVQGNPVEEWVINTLCQPCLQLIPSTVSPNSITFVNLLVVILSFVCGVIPPNIEDQNPYGAFALRCACGLCIWGSMVLDCLDGMQARKTGQTSKLGEVLDHWTDALTLPLTVLGLAGSLGLFNSTYAIAVGGSASLVANLMVYNAQVVIYYHTKKFLHPPNVNGVAAQLIGGVGHILVAGIFLGFKPHADTFRTIFIVVNTIVVLDPLKFYYFGCGSFVPHLAGHLKFVSTGVALNVLLASGMLHQYTYMAVQTTVSFRFTGTYILRTLVGGDFDGFDVGVAVWLAVAAGLAYVGDEGQYLNGCAWLLAVYLLVRNAKDLVVALPLLRK